MTNIKTALRLAAVIAMAEGVLGAQEPSYIQSERIQITESCPTVAKWLTQGLSASPHWQMLRYDEAFGLLSFRISAWNLTKAEIHGDITRDSKARNAHAEEMVFTLRSLVSSALSFGPGQGSRVDSCTITGALKYADKEGRALYSSGVAEKSFWGK
jgi:hypothetical protein